MNVKQQSKWLVDAAAYACLIAAFALDLTGVALHQWIGVIGGAIAGYHLVLHWKWVSAMTRRFFGRQPGKARLYYLVDAALLLGYLAIAATGLVISTWLSLSLGNYAAWLTVHIAVSIVTLLVTLLKIGLHGRWVITVARNAFSGFGEPLPKPATARQTTQGNSMSRRDFLGLMGIAGVASLLALSSAANSLSSLQNGEAGTASTSNSTSVALFGGSSSPASSEAENQETLTCSGGCPHRCSYPGHCRRYVDTNGNNLCDIGECA